MAAAAGLGKIAVGFFGGRVSAGRAMA